MAYTKKTLRKMRPATRKVAELANEAELLARRLRRLVDAVVELELQADAFKAQEEARRLLATPVDFSADEWHKSGLAVDGAGRVQEAK